MSAGMVNIFLSICQMGSFLYTWHLLNKRLKCVHKRGRYIAGVVCTVSFVLTVYTNIDGQRKIEALRSIDRLYVPLRAGMFFDSQTEPQMHSSQFPSLAWNGEIGNSFLEFLESATEKTNIMITSPGGEATSATLAALVVHEKRLHLTVVGSCMSACADYLLPAAAGITLERLPAIGFHGNPAVAMNVLSKLGRPSYLTDRQYKGCSFLASEVGKVWERGKVQQISTLMKMEILVPSELRPPVGYCPQVVFQKKWYLPKSEKLSQILGKEVVGKTCSDDTRCLAQFLDRRGLTITDVIVE
jgi:hypothetical protein